MRLAYRCACVMTALGTLVSAPGGASLAMSELTLTTFREKSDFSRLSGVWRSRGYGWLISIARGQARFYDESAGFCLEDPGRAQPLEDLADRFELNADGRTVQLPLGDETYLYTFDKIAGLPRACGIAPDASPGSVLDAVDEIFSAHYAFFALRKIDWRALIGEARTRVNGETSDDELFDIVKELLRHSGDAHVSLEARIDGERVSFVAGDGKTLTALAAQAERRGIDRDDMAERWEASHWTHGIGRTLLAGRGRATGNGLIRYGLIGRDIGYFSLLAMEGLGGGEPEDVAAVERALDGAMALFARARAVIVDVTMNDGGHDKVARAIASRFAAERTLAYYKSAGDADVDRPQAIHIEPSARSRFTGPVYLMTSDVTLSAAEVLVLAMRALPNVTHVGEATRGCLSDNLHKPLPNGWSVSLSNEVYLDRDGKLWEGRGIPPEIKIGIFSAQDVTEGHLAAVRKVVALARTAAARASARGR